MLQESLMSEQHTIACHECDLINSVPDIPEGSTANCIRCGCVLYSKKKDSIDRTLAFTIAGLILFALSNAYPILGMKSEGILLETTLIEGVTELYAGGMWALALLVFLTCLFVPILQLSGLLYIILPIKMNRLAWKTPIFFRYLRKLQPWAMMEVFMLGILVSIVKLAKMAEIIPGLSLFAFAVLIFVLAGAISSLDPHLIWERMEEKYE
jgi:paraquat-inducible protein A